MLRTARRSAAAAAVAAALVVAGCNGGSSTPPLRCTFAYRPSVTVPVAASDEVRLGLGDRETVSFGRMEAHVNYGQEGPGTRV